MGKLLKKFPQTPSKLFGEKFLGFGYSGNILNNGGKMCIEIFLHKMPPFRCLTYKNPLLKSFWSSKNLFSKRFLVGSGAKPQDCLLFNSSGALSSFGDNVARLGESDLGGKRSEKLIDKNSEKNNVSYERSGGAELLCRD